MHTLQSKQGGYLRPWITACCCSRRPMLLLLYSAAVQQWCTLGRTGCGENLNTSFLYCNLKKCSSVLGKGGRVNPGAKDAVLQIYCSRVGRDSGNLTRIPHMPTVWCYTVPVSRTNALWVFISLFRKWNIFSSN